MYSHLSWTLNSNYRTSQYNVLPKTNVLYCDVVYWFPVWAVGKHR